MSGDRMIGGSREHFFFRAFNAQRAASLTRM